jgi:hypothetical protein
MIELVRSFRRLLPFEHIDPSAAKNAVRDAET